MGRRRNSLRLVTRGMRAKASSGKFPPEMKDIRTSSTSLNNDRITDTVALWRPLGSLPQIDSALSDNDRQPATSSSTCVTRSQAVSAPFS